jgi:hypothetical protein
LLEEHNPLIRYNILNGLIERHDNDVQNLLSRQIHQILLQSANLHLGRVKCTIGRFADAHSTAHSRQTSANTAGSHSRQTSANTTGSHSGQTSANTTGSNTTGSNTTGSNTTGSNTTGSNG